MGGEILPLFILEEENFPLDSQIDWCILASMNRATLAQRQSNAFVKHRLSVRIRQVAFPYYGGHNEDLK